jgi:hypothetical protein
VPGAISLATKAAEGFETVLGNEHQDTLEFKKNLEGIKNVLEAQERSIPLKRKWTVEEG